MAYVKFEIPTEIQKYFGGLPTAAPPEILFALTGVTPARSDRPLRSQKSYALPDSRAVVFTVAEVAALMGVSRQSVVRLFENEPGVISIKRPERMHKRSYCSLRIPRAVYERVLRRLSV